MHMSATCEQEHVSSPRTKTSSRVSALGVNATIPVIGINALLLCRSDGPRKTASVSCKERVKLSLKR